MGENGLPPGGRRMRLLPATLLALVLAAAPAHGQGSNLIWSGFSTGYQAGQSDSSAVEGLAGQMFAGRADSGAVNLGSGFFFGYTATSLTVSISLPAGWNLISVPLSVGNYDKSILYPTAASRAFGYEGSYVVKNTLSGGAGYWIRFSAAADILFEGFTRVTDTVAVAKGWNLIGSVSRSIPVVAVTSVPPGMATTPFFGYAGSYQTSSTIEPGKAYWVKVEDAGLLVLSSSGSPGGPGRIRVIQTQERPPMPPLPEDTPKPASSIPKEYSLRQNFPNPFNPSTKMSFAVARLSLVTLRVYDVLGQEVATLVNEVKEPGEYRVEWDASRAASGLYFCRLDAKADRDVRSVFSKVMKMVLIR